MPKDDTTKEGSAPPPSLSLFPNKSCAPDQTIKRRSATSLCGKLTPRFPQPSDDYIEGRIDLNKHPIKNPPSTFLVRVTGESMIDVDIHDGDLLVVDRSIDIADHRVVIAFVDGEFIVKRVERQGRKLYLVAENKDSQPIEIEQEQDFEVWGVVTHVIHAL